MKNMEEDRPLYFGRIVISFILATLLFFAGFWVSQLVSYGISEGIEGKQEELQYQFFNLMLQREILADTCDFSEYESFFRQLDEMGKHIATLERRLGKKDDIVLKQKKVYSMLLAQHFLLIKDRNKVCEEIFPTVLFFYSNNPNYIDQAYSMGRILSFLKGQDKNIMIYSFDYDLDSEIVDSLKFKYNIAEPNTIIINGEEKLEGIEHINEIKEEYLYP